METPQAAVERLGLSIKAEFVPFSRSRNAANDLDGKKPSERSLNWRVTLMQARADGANGAILTTDYSAGVGHCPGYKQGAKWTADYAALIVWETEHGRPGMAYSSEWGSAHQKPGGKPITPMPLDFIHSLVMDADVLNYSSFDDWAPDAGYNPDSRKGEAIYRACLEIALKMRNGIGEKALADLAAAFQDY